MKKIISILIVLVLAASVFIMPTSAASKNAQVTIQYTTTPPVLDGVVQPGEYGKKIHSVDYSNDEFIADLDKDKSIKADFYMCWTDDSLYMAWVVKTDGHWPIDLTVDYNKDGKADAATDGPDLGFMYKFSCVQFMMCTGEPNKDVKKYQTAQWSGDYLEVGLSIQKDGESKKIAWSKPKGGENLTTDAWDFSGARDEAKKTTTYEVRIPWNKSGVTKVGDGIKFGLTYAIGDQEDFDKEPNMCEWQDAILNGKNMDAAAVITLAGKKGAVVEVSQDTSETSLPKGGFVLPANATSLKVDYTNTKLATGKSAIITDIKNLKNYNLKGATLVLVRPKSGSSTKFSVVSVTKNDSDDPKIDGIKDGDVILAYHSNGEGTAGYEKVKIAQSLKAGDPIVIVGYDLASGKKVNSDALIYLEGASEESSQASSTSKPTTSTETSSKAESSKPSTSSASSTSKAASETPAENEGDTTLLWIIVVAVVVIGGGVAAYFIISKKKKQQ